MYITYIIDILPKEKKDFIGYDNEYTLYSNYDYVKMNKIIPKDFPTVYNLYKYNSEKINEFLNEKVNNIENNKLNGIDNIGKKYKTDTYEFDLYKLPQGSISTTEEQIFKAAFLKSCIQSDIIIINLNLRFNNLECSNNIIISLQEILFNIKSNTTLVLTNSSAKQAHLIQKFFTKTNIKNINIIFSTSFTSWIDYNDIISLLDRNQFMITSTNNLCNFLSLGELRLRKSLISQFDLSYALDNFDGVNRILHFLEGLYVSPLYNSILETAGENINKNILDYIIYLHVEMLCYPFTYINIP